MAMHAWREVRRPWRRARRQRAMRSGPERETTSKHTISRCWAAEPRSQSGRGRGTETESSASYPYTRRETSWIRSVKHVERSWKRSLRAWESIGTDLRASSMPSASSSLSSTAHARKQTSLASRRFPAASRLFTLGGAPQTASSFSRMARTEESLRALKRRCVSESTAWGRSSRFASSTSALRDFEAMLISLYASSASSCWEEQAWTVSWCSSIRMSKAWFAVLSCD
mmetsp:Transcript_3027/g.7108  ORF Transcript_3027/g.7108 Transcript_3027/m.7108 type:complete len:227 (+) Transcript_3027:20-700(+)